MRQILRALIAAWGANKIGGGKCGCIGVVVVFILLWIVLKALGI